MIRNNKGFGIIGFIFLFVLLIVMWALILAPLFNTAGANAIANGATGLEAFFWNNINLWFFLCLLLVAVIYLRLAGGGT
jgi:hypothetical protein